MAYQTKYRCEFADYLNLNWKIEFLLNPWAGDVITLKATGDPLHIEFLSDSDEFNDPIRPSKAVINVHSLTDFALLDFYSDQDFRIKCNIYCGANIYWTGFVITGEYQEPYDGTPYPVRITAVDGLNYLKNILYDDGATPPVYYNGRILESQIIIDILAKIQIPETAGNPIFTEYINIYEAAMHTAGTDTVYYSPLDQVKIDVDIFQDMYCYEVLAELLKKYNAVIRQVKGQIVIYRPTELIQDIVYGRIFTSAAMTNLTSNTPAQQISRTGSVTNLKDIPGSVLMTKPPVKKITLNQDYGNKESLIENWEFKQNTFIGTDFTSWTQTAGTNAVPISNSIKEGNNGVYLDSYDTTAPYGYHISSTFGSLLKATSNSAVIEFDYLLDNRSGSTINSVGIWFSLEQLTPGVGYGGFDLAGNGHWVNHGGGAINITTNCEPGSSGWLHYKLEILDGLSVSVPLIITLFSSNNLNARVAYKNIQFYFYSTEILTKSQVSSGRERYSNLSSKWNVKYIKLPKLITERQYIVSNAIFGKALEYDYLLGDVADANIDNVIEQFAGSLATWVSSVIAFSSVWNTSPGGGLYPLLEIICGEIGYQYSRPKQLIQFALLETDPADTVLNIIGNIQDPLNQVSAVNRKFVFNAGEFSVKERQWQADLLEIIG